MTAEAARPTTPRLLVTIAAFVVVVAGMRMAASLLVPFLLAAFIAILCVTPFLWLQRRGLPTWLALIVVILIIIMLLFGVGAVIGTSINDFTDSLPQYQERLEQQYGSAKAWLEKVGFEVPEPTSEEAFGLGSIMKMVANFLTSLGGMLTNSILILFTVIFMLLEASSFASKLRLAFGDAEGHIDRLRTVLSNIKQYMAIKSLTSLATGVLVGVWVAVLGVDFPLLWGLLAFLLNYVPSIGSIIAAVPAILLALVQLGPGSALLVAAGYLVVNSTVGNVIEPRFMGRGLGLSTLVVFVSLVFWGWVLGPIGMFLSVPLTVTAKIGLQSFDNTRWMAVLLGSETEPPEEEPEVVEEVSEA